MAGISSAAVKKSAEKPLKFFPHDSNAVADIKIKRLIRRYGFEGYGRWWRICEMLAANHGHKIALETDEDAEILAEELAYPDVAECLSYIKSLSDIGLLVMDGKGAVFSERMYQNAEAFGKKREAGRKGMAARYGKS